MTRDFIGRSHALQDDAGLQRTFFLSGGSTQRDGSNTQDQYRK
jgi:hypothetical protein